MTARELLAEGWRRAAGSRHNASINGEGRRVKGKVSLMTTTSNDSLYTLLNTLVVAYAQESNWRRNVPHVAYDFEGYGVLVFEGPSGWSWTLTSADLPCVDGRGGAGLPTLAAAKADALVALMTYVRADEEAADGAYAAGMDDSSRILTTIGERAPQMQPQEIEAHLAARKAEAPRIDAASCVVEVCRAGTLDPYQPGDDVAFLIKASRAR
jgi:hypothetical protein